MLMASVISRRCSRASPTCRSPQEVATRSCSGATARPPPAASMLLASCDPPALVTGLTYVQVAAGVGHTVLLRSDGTAVACGTNDAGQCDLPALVMGLTYVQVAAVGRHTVLLRSDGTAVACGANDAGQCDLPALVAGLTYVAHLMPTLLLQASLDGDFMQFTTPGGQERYRTRAVPATCLADIYEQLMVEHRSGRFGYGVAQVDVILPGNQRLSGVPARETVANVFGAGPPG
ncbi:unnamed protein product [Prorocentrum cordatum]|uniref:Uncharacterized protein n=1 Tax=Prorocentrum cordatum TaxID=2364126 RepID=A0ABN9S945_9DINO|nr:unnamed protein product [Polarella glacialis]